MEELLNLINSTANMLRGMIFDPAIPEHAKEALVHRIDMLEEAYEKHSD